MSTNRKEVKKYILSRIDFEGYTTKDGQPYNPKSDNDKIILAYNIACNEVGYMREREGNQAMIEYWLSGLCSVVSIPYSYADIIPLAIQWGSIPENYTEKQAEKICNNWFRYMACQFMQMYHKAVNSR